MKTRIIFDRVWSSLHYRYELFLLYLRVVKQNRRMRLKANWVTWCLVLIKARPLLKEVYRSRVKSLRNFYLSVEPTRSNDREARQLVVTFSGIKSDKCLCIRQNYQSLGIVVRTITDSGHSVVKPPSVRGTFVEGYIGDFLELYRSIWESKGWIHAQLWLFWQVAKSYVFFRALLGRALEIVKWLKSFL